MDIFRINKRMDHLTNNLEQAYPQLKDFIRPISRIILFSLPIVAGFLYEKLFFVGWSYLEGFHLMASGSETECSFGYIFLLMPLVSLLSISFILPSCWAIRSLNLSSVASVIDLITALVFLLMLGWILPTCNDEVLKQLSVITTDRATLLSALYYGAVALTLTLCHWPTQLRPGKRSLSVASE